MSVLLGMRDNMSESEKVKYEMKTLQALPESVRNKASKYDVIIEDFIKSKAPFAEISIPDVENGYLTVQLQKRVTTRKLKDVSAHMVNGKTYLARELEVKPKPKPPTKA